VDIARPQRKRAIKATWERDLEKELMWTAGFTYSWRKMGTAAIEKNESVISLRVTRHKSSLVTLIS